MKRHFCSFWLIVCSVLALASAGTVCAETLSVNAAINKAGRQRMLSQRMAKAYCQLGLGVDPERSKRILEQSIAQFDKNLIELKAYSPTPEIKDTYARLEQAWTPYRQLLSGDANLENAKTIAKTSEEVLNLAQQGTLLLEKHAGTTAGMLINVAGRQRMLSQRIASISMFRAWGITSPQMAQSLDTATREFSAAQQLLTSAPQNTADIRGELQLATTQWLFFDEALRQTGVSRAEQLRNIASTSERILQVMENVTTLYERIPK